MPEQERINAQRKLQCLVQIEGSLAKQYRKELLARKARQAYSVFYLPLMSTYRIDLWPKDESAATESKLNDLLLAWEVGAESTESDFGRVFKRSQEGFFIPLISGQVDDLTQLSNEVLRRLIKNFAKLIREYPPPVFGLIDCDGLSWEQVAITAALSDSLCFDPATRGYAAKESRRALQKLFAEVPPQVELLCLKAESPGLQA
ncbi:MAG: hypothetical protein Q4P08_02530 [Eubacteriales bacterium]|nr:hypothetical protein [Eubacteriales bacterium]